MNFLIVTGLSGAGKSMAVNALEDIGFFCIDNIPVALLPRIVDFALQGENQLNRVAVVMDVRGVRSSEKLQEALADLDDQKIDYDILFLDANDAAIQRRYEGDAPPAPAWLPPRKSPITEAIARERRLLQPLRDKAKYVIDTSLLSRGAESGAGMQLVPGSRAKARWPSRSCPSASSMDCRRRQTSCSMSAACPTPSTCRSSSIKTGLDQEVVDYVMASEESQELLHRYEYHA